MSVPTKIDFQYRRIPYEPDVTDIAQILFLGNRNQQHAAARILLSLRGETLPVRSLSSLCQAHGFSRRTLERTRAKLARLGLIERVTWMNSRYGGQEGWKLSGRMSNSLRRLAAGLDAWRSAAHDADEDKEEALAEYLRPQGPTRST